MEAKTLGGMIARGMHALGLTRTTSKARRVLFVSRFCGLGGVETATLTKAEALRRVGIEASVLFSEFYGDGARGFAHLPGVTVSADEPTVIRLLRRGFDAIVVIDYPEFLEVLIRNTIGVPILFETHCANLFEDIQRFYRHMSDPCVRAIVVPSHHNKQLICERENPSCDVVVIPNGVNEWAFRPGRPSSPSMLPEMCDKKKIVLWVGRLENEKNPRELIDIARGVLDRTKDIRFLMVGDRPGRYEKQKSSLIKVMHAPTRSAFTFLRTVPHECMPELYRIVTHSGGILLSTSRYESLPMTFLEAMASGCPVVSSDVGGVRDVISDRLTGRLYPSGDVIAAIEVLQELFSADARQSVEQMTLRARQHVVQRHAPDVVARQYSSLLNELLGPSKVAMRDSL